MEQRSVQPPIQERSPMQSSRSDRSMQSHSSSGDLQEAVRLRAYEIYMQRGMAGGSELEDWLQAEAEILSGNRSERAA